MKRQILNTFIILILIIGFGNLRTWAQDMDCYADFRYEQMSDLLTYEFYDSSYSSANIEEWLWDFGDGSTSFEQNPIHTFNEIGEYPVSLTITSSSDDSLTCSNTIEYVIIAGDSTPEPECELLFWWYQEFGSFRVNFSATAFGLDENMDYSWDFGDGTSGTGFYILHEYAEAGEYQVTVSVNTEECGEISYTEHIVVEENTYPSDCYADFWYEQDYTDPKTVQFLDYSYSQSEIMEWLWDFGDGTTAHEQNPIHSYAEKGEYIVSLTATSVSEDSSACISTMEQFVYIEDSIPNPDCEIFFLWYQEYYSNEVYFNTEMYNFTNDIVYTWNFGDGNTGTGYNPGHEYAETGEYEVTVSAYTEECGEISFTEYIFVEDNQFENACSANFYFITDSTGYTINFIDDSWPQQNITEWNWDFGDGNTSSEQNPTHAYSEGGEYMTKLTIISTDSVSDESCESTMEQMVWVGESNWYPEDCQAFFFPEYDWNDPNTVNFFDLSWGGNGNQIIARKWDFGDGTESKEQFPTHTYENTGEYTVGLTIYTDSCSNTFEEIVYINDWTDSFGDCQAIFYPEFDSTLTVKFYDMSFPDAHWRNWDFGDGNTSSEQNPSNTYSSPGVYHISMESGNENCTGLFEMDIELYDTESKTTTYSGRIIRAYASNSTSTTVENPESQFNITLFPNPASDVLTVDFGTLINNAEIAIYNITGQELIKKQINSNRAQVNVEQLTKGIYIARIRINGQTAGNIKFIK